MYKDAKYSTKWWLKELEPNHTKAIKELSDKQDRIYYGIDIYSSSIGLKPVIHPIKESDKVVNNNKTF